jgi:cysteine synthase
MPQLGLERTVIDPKVRDASVRRCAEREIVLPTFAQLAEPSRIPERVRAAAASVDPDDPHPLNLFRVHWYNADDRRGVAEVAAHVVLPPALTGVRAPILVALGDRFPMIHAHKVLAAYGCLAPRLVTGQFDPERERAIWPSTGNYCRGGVAISRIMACRGVAVLPEGMSAERFAWLSRWVEDPSDVIRTPGTESNVKEIYDECARLSRDPANVVFNQFSEFGNYLAHFAATGRALEDVVHACRCTRPRLEVAAFVSATGSAGTLAAGDYLKERLGARIAAVEALECPTLLLNGFGEHNIQGIGDKHVPLIHNVMNTDFVIGVSDRATDALNVVFGTDAGRRYLLQRRAVPAEIVATLPSLGLSSICNVLASIKLAKYCDLGPDEAVLTVATDGAPLYASEVDKVLARRYAGGFDEVSAAEAVGEHLAGMATDHVEELRRPDRQRIFNLGYFTWVEQQGVPATTFVARRDQRYWRDLRDLLPAWDDLIDEFNARVSAAGGRPAWAHH